MADGNFLIGLGVDTTRAKKDVSEFYSYLSGEQAKAGSRGARVAQLPKNVAKGAFSDAADPAGLRKSKTLQKEFIQDKAKLLALLERQVALTAKARGGKLDKQGLPVAAAPRDVITKARAGVESSIARSLGLEELTPAIKGQLTKSLGEIRGSLTASLSGLKGAGLQREFSRQATTVLGTTSIAASKVSTASGDKAAAQSQRIAAEYAKELQSLASTASSAQRKAEVDRQLLAAASERLLAARRAASKSDGSALLAGRITESEAKILGLSNQRAQVLNRALSKAKAAEGAISYKAGLTGQADPLNRAISLSRVAAAPPKYKDQLTGTTSPLNRALSQSATAGSEKHIARAVIAQKAEADASERAAASQNKSATLSAEQVSAKAQELAASEQAAIAEKKRAINAIKLSAAMERALALIQTAGVTSSTQLKGLGVNANTIKGLGNRGLIDTADVNGEQIVKPSEQGALRSTAQLSNEELNRLRGVQLASAERIATASALEATAAEKRAADEAAHTAVQKAQDGTQDANEARTTVATQREAQASEARAAVGAGGSGGRKPPGGGRRRKPPPPPDDDGKRSGAGPYSNSINAETMRMVEEQLIRTGATFRLLNNEAAPLLPVFGSLLDEYLENKAAMTIFNEEIKASTLGLIANDTTGRTKHGTAKAQQTAYNSRLTLARDEAIANNPALSGELASNTAQSSVYRLRRQVEAKGAAASENLTREQLELSATLDRLEAATLRLAGMTENSITAAAERRNADLTYKNRVQAAAQSQPSGQAAIIEARRLADEKRLIATGTRKRGFAGLLQRSGYDRTGGSSPREFFGGGALASLRYGLPSMLMYGAFSGIKNTTKEAEELNYSLSILEGQFESTFEGQDFSPVRQQIIDIAKDTGLAADELALLRVQLTGAFADKEIDGLGGSELIENQTESAAKLAQTIKLPLKEVTDGLTAASLAFDDASFERIGDVAVKLEEVSGVLAKETVSFIGDIAPVAEEAGYSLEEFSAIAAVAQQRSGRSGAALAESFGRVIPEISKAKDELFALASTEDALANDSFVDAIRKSDPKAILSEIGKAYGDLSTEGKQQVTQVLGGRREAQAIIPVITNPEAVEEFTKQAEDSVGSLDRRFEKVKNTLTNTFQRLGETIRELAITLLDSGITDVLKTAAKLLGIITGLLNPLLGFVGDINDALAGWPLHILAAVAAYKTLLAFQAAGEDTRRGAFASGILGAPGRMAANFRAGQGASLFAQTGNMYRGAALGQVGAGARFPTLARGAGLTRAGGAGLLSVLGGGSVATGGVIAGVVALTAAYSAVKGQINQENEALEKAVSDINEENTELEIFDPDTDQSVRDRRVEALTEQANNLQRSYDNSLVGWQKFNVALLGAQSQAEVVLAEAAKVEAFDPDVEAFFDDTDLGIDQDLSKKFAPKLGRGLSGFNNALKDIIIDEYGTFGDKFRDSLKPAAWLDTLTFGATANSLDSLRDDEKAYLEDLAKKVGVKTDELDHRLAQLIVEHYDNVPAALEGVLSGDIEVVGGNDDKIIEQTAALRDYFAEKGGSDPEIQKQIEAIKATKLDPYEQSILEYEQIGDAYDAGLLTFKEYTKRLAENAESRKNILESGTSDAGEQELLQILKDQKADAEAASAAITGRQETLTKIREALGATEEELEFKSAADNTKNLSNPNFTDPEARLDAALELQKARVNTELRIANEAGNLERVNQIINEGIDVKPDVRGVIYAHELTSSNDDIEKLVTSYISVADDLQEGLDVMSNPDFADALLGQLSLPGEKSADTSKRLLDELGEKGFYKALTDAAEPIKEALNRPIEKIIEDVLADVFEDGVLSTDNLWTLNNILSTIGQRLQVDGLGKNEIDSLYGTLDGIVQLLDFAGVAQEDILAAVTPADANFFQQTGLRLQVGAAIGRSTLDKDADAKARADQQDATGRADKMRELTYDFKKAQAHHDKTAVAYLELEAANAELLAAKASTDDDKEVKIKEAELRILKANQGIEDAVLAANKGSIELQKAFAEAAGDSIQAAILDSASVNLDLRNDPNNDSIKAQLVSANESIRKAMISQQQTNYELLQAMADANGDTVGAARVAVAQAQFVLNNAKGVSETNNAKVALLQAKKQLRDAFKAHRAEQFDLLTAIIAGEDPLIQAKIAQAEAKEILQGAVGPSEIAQARIALIEADRAVNKAMQEIRSSVFDLRQAQLDAVGDEVGSAQVAAQKARQQLADAIANQAGQAQINSLRAQVITADKAAKDAVFNERRGEYDFLFEMGRITKSQYINYLEGLKSTLIPGTAQFRDLELAIKRLKDDLSSDLQANLPTSLALPTLYEVRRLNQTPTAANAAAGTSIGYQDNRKVDIQVTIGQNMDEGQIVDVMSRALNVGTVGSAPRRY